MLYNKKQSGYWMGEDTGHPFENLSKEIEFFFTNYDFLLSLTLQPNVVALRHFKHMNSVTKFEISRVYTIRWKNIAIRKPEFVTNTQFF